MSASAHQSDPDQRVVITGMGWVTPLGVGVDRVWRRLVQGESAVGPVTRFPAESYATNFAAEVRGFDLADFLGADRATQFGETHRSTQFALAAASDAWTQAGLADATIDPQRVGVYLGAGEGPPDFPNFAAAHIAGFDPATATVPGPAFAAAAKARLDPICEREQEPDLTLAHVARAFNARGPASNCMTACAASTQSIGEARELILHDEADAMIAGGSHSMIHPLGMTGFIRLTAMSTRREEPQAAARPFDMSRDGFVMGEGAGVLVLERLSHALDRGATPLAEITGYGSSADAYRITDMHPDGAGPEAAIRIALADAGLSPREPRSDGRPPVDYISAHGTGTKENDSIETRAIHAAFGPQAERVMMSSIKSMMGHLIQAAGAVELITCVQAIRTGVAPPTINLREPDPACDLDYIPNAARDRNADGGIEICLSNGFGFGGQNDALIVRRFDTAS